MARALGEDKHGDDALAVLKQSKTLFPQSADVAAALGGALVQAGDVAGGKAELDRALSIESEQHGREDGARSIESPARGATQAVEVAPCSPRPDPDAPSRVGPGGSRRLLLARDAQDGDWRSQMLRRYRRIVNAPDDVHAVDDFPECCEALAVRVPPAPKSSSF